MKEKFTNYLNLYGLEKYEPLILASLVNENPMLLVGKHGSAKSYLLERLSKALDMNYKFYNASLIDYDDLVGIPVPNENKDGLEYISSKTSIWDAEVVFIDEINRTKPELQNKIFPIINEKRVQGEDLKYLKYRFAAMNPSYEEDELNYLGAMPLDEALADRFGFIIDVPSYKDLSEEDKKKAIKTNFDEVNYQKAKEILQILLERTNEFYEKLKVTLDEQASEFVYEATDLLSRKFGYISTRRALMFKNNLIAVHAARMALNSFEENDELTLFEDTIYLTIPNSMPQRANTKINEESLFRILKTVVTSMDLEGETKKFLTLEDPKEKLIYGFQHIKEIGEMTVYESIPTLIDKYDGVQQKCFLYNVYLALRKRRNCPASIIETVFNKVIEFRYYTKKANSLNARYYQDINLSEIKKTLENKVSDEIDKERENFLTLVARNTSLNESIFEADKFFIELYKGLNNE